MTDKPIKATLDSSDDSVKTQKPILIQLDDIPTPTSEDAGKVLGVDEDGAYALTEGGKKYYQHLLNFTYGKTILITSDPTPFTNSTFVKWLYDNGHTSGSNRFYSIVSTITNYIDSLHTLYIYKNLGQYSEDAVTIKSQFDRTSITVNNGELSGTTLLNTSGTDSLNYDKVTEII